MLILSDLVNIHFNRLRQIIICYDRHEFSITCVRLTLQRSVMPLKTIWSFLLRAWSSISFYLFPNEIKGRKPSSSAEEIEISEQAAFLCQKYIEARFTRSDLCYFNPRSRRKDEQSLAGCPEDVVQTLCEIGALLERSYPKLYNNVLDQLNYRANLAILVYNIFNRVSEQIIVSGVSWARIVAVYAFAGALAYDFTQTGDTRFIRSMSNWMGHFSARRLSPWIRQNGGWVSINLRLNQSLLSILSIKVINYRFQVVSLRVTL